MSKIMDLYADVNGIDDLKKPTGDVAKDILSNYADTLKEHYEDEIIARAQLITTEDGLAIDDYWSLFGALAEETIERKEEEYKEKGIGQLVSDKEYMPMVKYLTHYISKIMSDFEDTFLEECKEDAEEQYQQLRERETN